MRRQRKRSHKIIVNIYAIDCSHMVNFWWICEISLEMIRTYGKMSFWLQVWTLLHAVCYPCLRLDEVHINIITITIMIIWGILIRWHTLNEQFVKSSYMSRMSDISEHLVFELIPHTIYILLWRMAAKSHVNTSN